MVPLLRETFDEREADNLFKRVLEEFFQKRFLDLQRFELGEAEMEDLTAVFQKIADLYPLQYIFRQADFYGLKFYVDESVLIPRPETEELVHWVLEENKSDRLYALDIGTGSGCIPIALKKHRPNWDIRAIDISPEALAVAQKNAGSQGTDVEFIQADILDPESNIRHSTLNIIISNPPYIPFAEKPLMSHSTLGFEPGLALFVPDERPLLFYDRIADLALEGLEPGGKLYFELNEFNAPEVRQLLSEKGFTDILLKQDMSGKDRMIRAVRP